MKCNTLREFHWFLVGLLSGIYSTGADAPTAEQAREALGWRPTGHEIDEVATTLHLLTEAGPHDRAKVANSLRLLVHEWLALPAPSIDAIAEQVNAWSARVAAGGLVLDKDLRRLEVIVKVLQARAMVSIEGLDVLALVKRHVNASLEEFQRMAPRG